MSRLLLLYATREGQTAKIAVRIAERLTDAGHTVEVVNAADKPATENIAIETYDRIIFGASMHAGGLEREITRFISSRKAAIETIPRSLFVVLLSAATKDPEVREKTLADAREKIDASIEVTFDEVELLAGALLYSKYSWPMKWIMRRIARQAGGDTDMSRDYEYTDWEQVDAYAARQA
jgi:menaquinone-dependent protoporphyrinogen oxidase